MATGAINTQYGHNRRDHRSKHLLNTTQEQLKLSQREKTQGFSLFAYNVLPEEKKNIPFSYILFCI